MPSKEDLLKQLSVKKLRELAKENRVLLLREDPWSFSSKKIPAKTKNEIIEVLNKSRKVSKKKVEDMVFGKTKKTSSGASSRTKPKRKRLSKAEKTMILKSQNFKCAMCKRDISKITPHFDHRIPLAIGGSDTITNIQALCGTCHTEKSKFDKLEIARSKRS